jgi:tRNA1Val (adenine37-N6)-methyltransferase
MEYSNKNTRKRKGFQCKQFFVAHDKCAMKVGTDSLILGSWCDTAFSKRILDIGSGSGILSLMLAQKTEAMAQVIGIDIDASAVRQAIDNATNTKWRDKISFVQTDIATYRSPDKFDLIISNPPYFAFSQSASIKMTASRRQARQTASLSFEQLIQSANELLSDTGQFYLIIPQDVVPHIEELARSKGFAMVKRLKVKSKSDGPFIRQCLCLGYHESSEYSSSTLIIYNDDGSYTKDYRTLCRGFYLSF